MSPRWLSLRGRDYPDLGAIGVARFPDAGALALSRGAQEKSYGYVDPNEDGVLVVRTRSGALLAVVDGHNGLRASELTLDSAREHARELIEASDTAFAAQAEALVRSLAASLARERRSRTCLLLASIRAERCRWASFGDCCLYRAMEYEPLNPANGFVIGPRLRRQPLPTELWLGAFIREAGERVAVMSDGIPNFVPDVARIPEILRDAPDDGSAAVNLTQTAMAGGAGDNVAVAVFGA